MPGNDFSFSQKSLTKEVLIDSIKKDRQYYESLLEKITKEKNFNKKVKLAYKALNFVTNTSTGYYSSDVIEKVFLEISQKNHINLSSQYQENSVLHVMTSSYAVGGHTRIVERWINSSPDNEKHSIFILKKERSQITELLKESVNNKKGQIYTLPFYYSDIKKALKLREIASKYSRIILHIHMNDPIALIAFGTPDFKRPVFFFNHADHKFWLGVSISNKVVDFREFGQNITKNLRGSKNNFKIHLAIDKKTSEKQDIVKLKEKLNLPLNKKILITVGQSYKYIPFLQWNFTDLLEELFKRYKDILVIIIGPTLEQFPEWEKFDSDKILLLGYQTSKKMFEYLVCSDLCIDSFPLGGATTMIDAISVNCPIVSFGGGPGGQIDCILKSPACCKDMTELLNKIDLLLKDVKIRNENLSIIHKYIEEDYSLDKFLTEIHSLYSSTNEHKIYEFKSKANQKITDLDLYLCKEFMEYEIKLRIPYLFKLRMSKYQGKIKFKFIFFSK